jgi:hypothetical protein
MAPPPELSAAPAVSRPAIASFAAEDSRSRSLPAPAPWATAVGDTALQNAVPLNSGPFPQICEQFSLQMLLLAEQLRIALDKLEADEGDPQRLDQLYEIDHGVTRMRRASLDLRVLAGRGGEPLDGPVTSLLDVIRMAASAIERYGQVHAMKVTELAVVGYAADDVGLLLSALLQNATQYSPGPVTVSAHLLDDGSVMFRVEDTGIGMAPDRVAAVNQALAAPVPEIDDNSGRHTGFPVVHRIASRHKIKVRLASRSAPYTGIVAMVTVPPHLLCEVPEDDESGKAPATTWGPPDPRWAPGPREAAETVSPAAAPAARSANGELPRRESVSLRGARPRRAAASVGTTEHAAADEAAARRAFADDLGAFATAASPASGTDDPPLPAPSREMPWDEGSRRPVGGTGAQEGKV